MKFSGRLAPALYVVPPGTRLWHIICSNRMLRGLVKNLLPAPSSHLAKRRINNTADRVPEAHMPMPKKIIIIPAFNEENSIAAVIEGLRPYTDADIVVIDDCSQDRTGAKAREAGAFVIRHPFNLGYGAALQTGYKYAVAKGYDFLVQMDGDGQHDPRYVPALFEQLESQKCHVVIGSRFLGGGDYRAGLLKSIGIWLFKVILGLITGQNFTDPTSGFQCLNRNILKIFIRDSFPTDYPDANIIVMLHRMGFTVREIPVAMLPNHKRAGMHRGFFTLSYYFFKMFLTIFIALIKEEPIPETL